MLGFFQRLIGGALTALHFHVMRFYRHYLAVVVVTVLLLAGVYMLLRAPLNFTPGMVTVSQGESALEVSEKLSDAQITTSKWPLWLLLRVSGGDSLLRSGTYRFDQPENVFSVARRLLTADYGMPVAKLTFFEGITVREMALLVNEAFPSVGVEQFTELAAAHEGYLFPDTYFFPPSSDAQSIIDTMKDTFDAKTAVLRTQAGAKGKSLRDVVIMASLLEKEARSDEHRRLVAGVLYNRLAKDMPLQVDAVFGYIFNRDTYSPKPEELKVDSPYNTYRNKGLPPGPINNPGLASLEAALNPTKTTYFYYLTGNDGTMHYATTYTGHKTNLQKYLQ